MDRYCRKCKVLLIVGENCLLSKLEHHDYICDGCISILKKTYYDNNKNKILKQQKEYYENNREKKLNYARKYNKEHPGLVRVGWDKWEIENDFDMKSYKKEYHIKNKGKHNELTRNYYANNKERLIKQAREYRKTPKGKEVHSKISAKRNRELGFNKLFENPFLEGVEIHWHHINDTDVVAIPKEIHQKYSGLSRKKHRNSLIPYIKKIYNIEILEE